MKNIKLYITFLFIILLSCPLTSQAIGQVTSPIIISDALPGEAYEERMTVIGASNASTQINISAEGQIKEWVSFYKPEDLNNSIKMVSLKAGEMIELTAKFNIPLSAAKGEYDGYISVSQVASENNFKNESGSSVTQKIDREVKIIVNTEEKINFNVSIIPETYDLTMGDPLKIRIIYDNQGNMEISPSIRLKLQNDDQTYYSVIFPYPENTPAVKPRAQYEIKTLEIPTTGYPRGKYIVSLDFYNYDTLSLSKDFYFNLRSQAEKQSLLMGIINEINKQGPALLLVIGLVLLACIAAIAGGLINRRHHNRYQKALKLNK